MWVDDVVAPSRCPGGSGLMRSVLIISEEYPFLLSSYSWLRQDARVGRIEVATNGDEGFDLAKAYRPDVVVFDATTGGEFGLSTVRRLRATYPEVDIVVTIRERSEDGIETSALASGAAGVLSRER